MFFKFPRFIIFWVTLTPIGAFSMFAAKFAGLGEEYLIFDDTLPSVLLEEFAYK